jgi:peptidoglycan/LPS O-acetylase OafA/YrhL
LVSTTQDTEDDGVSGSSTVSAGFRGDIDGLRAIAILLIVAFHVGLPGFDGGFIGVDVFFVISGYLITRNLLAGGERVRLLQFWARRVRRLVPALSLMVMVTLVAAFVILTVVEREQIAREGASAAVYVSNILFARASQDYFAADVNESPFLHTWSLGVEEQFYLVWPLLVAGCVAAFRHPVLRRRALGIGFLLILIGSFGLNLRLTDQQSPWAFFSLPTRAWEFAAAGLLAAWGVPRLFAGVAARTAAAAMGLVLVVWATLTFSPDTPYPGSAALLPVLGTLLLIIAGDAHLTAGKQSVVSTALAKPPMQWVGRISYSWYLWHWPFIILAVAAFDEDRVRLRTVAALASLPVAYLTYRVVENPIRFSSALIRSVTKTIALGAAATLVVLVLAAGVGLSASNPPDSSIDAKLADARRHVFPCVWTATPNGIKYCLGGDPRAERRVVLVGDSHAAMWLGAMATIAVERGVGLVMHSTPGCPAIPVEVRPLQGALTVAECRRAHEDLSRLVDEIDPVAVFITQSDAQMSGVLDEAGDVASTDTRLRLWEDAYRELLERFETATVPVAVILDNPTFEENPWTCIADERAVEPCVTSRQNALALTGRVRDLDKRVVDDFAGVASFDPVEVLCDASRCALERNGALLYSDDDHLTSAATMLMEPNLRELWAEVVP